MEPTYAAPLTLTGVERSAAQHHTASRFNRVDDDTPRRALLDLDVDAGTTTIIRLGGDLDPATAPLLEQAVQQAVDTAGVDRVVLDLGGLAFIDSSGLRVFVTARQALSERGATLLLRNPSANTKRLLDITGLGEIISVD